MQNFFKKSVFLFGLVCLVGSSIFAQNYSVSKVLNAKKRGSGVITGGGDVNGYFSFYELDKADKKNVNYKLDILDANLSMLSSKNMVAEKGMWLAEVSYNGKHLMAKFANPKAKEFQYKIYDMNAELVKSYSRKPHSKYELVTQPKTEDHEDGSLSPVEGGFIEVSTKMPSMTKRGYAITFYPISGEKWVVQTDDKAKDKMQSAEFLGEKAGNTLFLVSKTGKNKRRDLDEYILSIGLKDGVKKFENAVDDEQYSISVNNCIEDPNSENFHLMGYYFKNGANVFKDKSLGLFTISVGPDGKVSAAKFNSWASDVSKFLPINAKGKIEDMGFLYFHKFVTSSDGTTIGISEEYRKVADGLGIAANIMSGGRRSGVANIKLRIEDFYIFVFDRNFNIKSIEIVDKAKSSFQLPQGYGLVSISLLGAVCKMYGGFDYEFAKNNKDKSAVQIGYTDTERKSGGGREGYFGSIQYSEGKFTTDKIKFNSKAKWYMVMPAKHGYVAIVEYFRKTKTVEFRMEKMNH